MKKLELTEYHTTIMKHVKEVDYFNNGKTTVAILTMKNGFDVVGTSSCVHRDSFDEVLGRHYALVDALGKMDAFIGFERQQEAYEQKMYVQEQEEIKRMQEEMAKEEQVKEIIRLINEGSNDGIKAKEIDLSGAITVSQIQAGDADTFNVKKSRKASVGIDLYRGGIVNTDKLAIMLKKEHVLNDAETKDIIDKMNSISNPFPLSFIVKTSEDIDRPDVKKTEAEVITETLKAMSKQGRVRQ